MKGIGNAIYALTTLALLFFSLALPVATLAGDDDTGVAWPFWHGNARNTGLSPYDTSGVDGTLRWAVSLPSKPRASPVIGSNGTIHLSTTGYWNPDNIHAPPIFSPGIYALGSDGSIKWNLTFNDYFFSSQGGIAIGQNGVVYGTPYGRNIVAMDRNGSLLWNLSMPTILSSPAISSDGTILVGCWDGLYAVSPGGAIVWNFTTRSPVYSSPAVDANGTIYFVDNDYKIYAVSQDGQSKWFASIKEFGWGWHSSCLSSPAIGADGTVYVGSPDGNLYAVGCQGLLKWKYKTKKAIYSSPAIGSDGTIYVGSSDNRFYAVAPNGLLKWLHNTGKDIESSPAIGRDGAIYLGTSSTFAWDSSEVIAFAQDGNVKWRRNVSGGVSSSPAIGSDGTVYVSSSQMLYAFSSTPLSYRMNMIYGVIAAAFAFAAAAYCARRLIPWESPKK